MLSITKVTAFAAAAIVLLSSNGVQAANCTATELEDVAKFDAVLGDAPECARLNSLIAGEVTTVQVCSDTDCVKLIKKVASQAPDCEVDGAVPISLVAFADCSVSADSTSGSSSSSVTTPSPSPSPEAAAQSSAGSSSSAAATVTTPAPTTAAPAASSSVKVASSVVVASVVAVMSAVAWM